jgi:hypothetical protein
MIAKMRSNYIGLRELGRELDALRIYEEQRGKFGTQRT